MAKKTTLINSLEQVFKRKYYSFRLVFPKPQPILAVLPAGIAIPALFCTKLVFAAQKQGDHRTIDNGGSLLYNSATPSHPDEIA